VLSGLIDGIAKSGQQSEQGHHGRHNTDYRTHGKVAALVYISAFAPDNGESVNTLIGQATPGTATSPILPQVGGFMFQDQARFYHSFAADLPAADAAYMADSQVPWGVDALAGTVTESAWRSKPSWFLVTTEDNMIPPSSQHAMAKRAGATMAVEVAASHAVYWSHPGAVAALIRQVRV
jgi:pimeloyl-ACP methyl ester carboxylesterase